MSVFGDRLAPERIRVQGPIAEVLGGDLGQRLLRDAVVVQIAVGLHPEELGGQVLAVLGVPARHTDQRGILGERAAGVLVQADRDADVVVAQPDTVGAGLRGAGGGGAGVEHVGERDAGSPTMPTMASGLATVQLPPVAAWMSLHCTPASATAAKMASTPICMADLPSNRPNGCRPTPMMATSFISCSSVGRPECIPTVTLTVS